ncbi:hypothetical protein [Xanthomonas bundabergensis]|uniref:hypothetical protein n=1 Tax=Xanthomonas bundabergensis TaxID=3160842 RepID=UPI003517D492
MSKKNDHAGADAADDISSLFAKLGSQGASAYQDFSAARLSAPEPVAAEPLPPAAPAPTLSVVRAPAEPRLVVALPAARPVPAAEPAAPAPAATTATPLTQLFQRLLDGGRDRAPTPNSPLKRILIR